MLKLLVLVFLAHQTLAVKWKLAVGQFGYGLYWDHGCDWPGDDIGNVAPIGSAKCGPKCMSTSHCTHFTWTNYNGGTCWLKGPTGPHSEPISGPAGYQSVCGYTYRASRGNDGPDLGK